MNTFLNYFKGIVLVCVFFFTSQIYAQMELPSIFSSGMVLQRDMPINIWGKGAPNQLVEITIAGYAGSTTSDADGNWVVEMPVMTASGPYALVVKSGTEEKIFSDVYIGDVWLASGQSNMEMVVSNADNGANVIASANDPKIRQFKIPKGNATEPSNDLPPNSNWTSATSQYVGNFTAVGYYFAENLRKNIDIPIGIINSSNGGSRIESWMSDEMLGYDESDTTLANGEIERQPTVLYNKMIHPIIKFAIKGVIWYQAESNGDSMEDALGYSVLFKKQIESWRQIWGLGDFPFLWVQLPNYGTVYDEPQNWDAWPQLRAGQSEALTLPNTGEAITIDLGAEDIHPTNKEPVGYRLSLAARKIAYGEDIVYASPRYASNSLRDDGKIVIDFTDLGGGLVAKDSSNNKITGFVIQDDDGAIDWADAVIDGDQVIVWNDQLGEPSIVRYAWEYNPANVNLFNVDGLPAAPFYANVNPGFKIAVFESARSAIETGQSTTLSWLVFGASSITLDGSEIDSIGTLQVSPLETTTYTIIAVNRNDVSEIDTATVTIDVLDPNQINRTLNKESSSSTFEACCGEGREPSSAVDGDFATRWSSAWSDGTGDTAIDPNYDGDPDDEWIAVDMGEAIDIERVILYWEGAYGKGYDLDVSYDGYLWNTVYEERNSNGGEDNIPFTTPVSGRFIRMHGVERATQYGYSLFEITTYGMLSAKKPPAVTVNTSAGNVLQAGGTTTLAATATDSDGDIVSVSLYVDNELVKEITAEPYETQWTAGANATYSAYAVVVDNDGLTVQSNPLTLYTETESFVRFEAEDAAYTGQGNPLNSGAASGGIFMEMRDAWTIDFNNVNVPEAGEYLLSIAYQLTFESPKSQFLVVNGDTLSEVEFTAPNTTSWLQKGVLINLNAGNNSIGIHGSWNWMSFDFIAVDGATIVSVEEEKELPDQFKLNQNYPNPFNPSTVIGYSIPKSGDVSINIYNIQGQLVTELVNEYKGVGEHFVNFDASNLSSGVYFYRIKMAKYSSIKSMVFLK